MYPTGLGEAWAKLRQKDRDARWTVKFSKARPREDGTPQADIAVPAFGADPPLDGNRGHDGARLEYLLARHGPTGTSS
jgi:IS5 family transposase